MFHLSLVVARAGLVAWAVPLAILATLATPAQASPWVSDHRAIPELALDMEPASAKASPMSDDEVRRFIEDCVAGRGAVLSLAEVQERSLDFIPVATAEEATHWASRARLAGLLPHLEARFGSDVALDFRDVRDDSVRFTRTQGRTLGFDVRVRFDLDGLVFHDAELRASRERLVWADEVRSVRERATRLYFDLLEALVERHRAPSREAHQTVARTAGILRALIGASVFREPIGGAR
ncbi:MAG: hypothetical protein IPK13_18045 [Deltaproteobacteria bacterium]|nr:hypothetical protein [Deltaproteobacteria bacterium]